MRSNQFYSILTSRYILSIRMFGYVFMSEKKLNILKLISYFKFKVNFLLSFHLDDLEIETLSSIYRLMFSEQII